MNTFPARRTVLCGTLFIATALASLSVGGILLTGFMLSVVIVCSGIFTLQRLPGNIRNFLFKHPLLTNLAATSLSTVFISPTTATGLTLSLTPRLTVAIRCGRDMAQLQVFPLVFPTTRTAPSNESAFRGEG